jgi:chemotaxis signal transduction protein
MTTTFDVEQRLLHFRRDFDQGFAAAPSAAATVFEDLLAIRVAGDPYALRVREIAGMVASRKVVYLPSRKPALLGITGIRGSVVPVYGLAALLGYGASARPAPWLALVGISVAVAFAFEEFTSFLRVESGAVHAAQRESDGPLTASVVQMGNASLRVVDIASMLAALDIHAGTAG